MDAVINKSSRRQISSEPHSVRLYEDNCEQLNRLCEETGQKPAEALRDLVDEALRARRSASIDAARVVENLQQVVEQIRQLIGQNQLLAENSERVVEVCEAIEDRATSLNQGLRMNFRQFYSVLLQTLIAAVGSRRIAWDYVARPVLDASGASEEEINQRYEDEMKASVMEGDKITKAAEEAVERSQFPPELDLGDYGSFGGWRLDDASGSQDDDSDSGGADSSKSFKP